MKEKKNAGFTLVELLVAMLMSLIIIGGVGQFMVAASNNYQAIDRQTNLQMEAQSVINSISDMVLESNNVALKEKDGQKYFIIYYNLGEKRSDGTLTDTNSAIQKIIWLDKTAHKLYLFACESNEDIKDAMGAKTKKMLFAEGVASINYAIANGTGNLSDGLKPASFKNSKPLIKIDVKLQSKITAQSEKEDGFTYTASDTIAPRNEIVPLS